MKRISEQPWLRKFLISMAGKPRLREFDRASRDIRATQHRALKRLVEQARDTAYGKDHRFDKVRSIDDYRKAVPVNTFEEHRPYVERMCMGESDVLVPGKPLFYNTTSGTTAEPKLIPITAEYLKGPYGGMTRLWLYTALRDNPRLYDGKSLSTVAPAVEGRVQDGTPYGSISGVTYRNIPTILKSTYSTPYPVIAIKDYQRKYYAMMRFALGCNLTYIVSASPSNIVRLHQTAMERYEDLVRDIRDGTLRKEVAREIEPDRRAEVLAALEPNPARATHLQRLMEQHGDDLRPKHYWPNLACVNTWKQGNFAVVIPKIADYFSESTQIRPFGYYASEVRGLVLGNDWDYSVLTAHAHHFEFIEEDARGSDNPPVLQAHEVEQGKRYYILFSNGTGLYRYDINDIVEIRGFYNQFPLFSFVRKGEGVTSLTGEKLTEPQVVQALDEVSRERGIQTEFYNLFCDENLMRYRLFVEFPPSVTGESKRVFATAVDEKLRVLNREYEIKRGSQRLEPPILEELGKRSYERLKETLVSRGMAREGQYKEVYLRSKPQFGEILQELRRSDSN